MLAKPIKNFSELNSLAINDFIYEEKYDGYRLLCNVSQEKNTFFTRELKIDSTVSFKIDLMNAQNCVLDGEVIFLNDAGELLPICETGTRSILKKQYKIFDIQELNGLSVMTQPLSERKELLRKHIKPNEHVQITEFFECNSINYMKSCFEELLKDSQREGYIIKNLRETYKPNIRGWFKLKAFHLNGASQIIELELNGVIPDKNQNLSILQCGYTIDGKFIQKNLVNTNRHSDLLYIRSLLQENKTLDTTRRFPPNTIGIIKFDRNTEKSIRHPVFCGFKALLESTKN